jgi:uncharacterized protein (TIGR02145 family)
MNPAVYYLSSLETYVPYVPTPILMPNGQVWDQKNLNTSVYSDGTRIPKVDAGWGSLSTGAWRYLDNDSTNATLFGRLYNWYAVNGVYDAASLSDPNLRKDIAPEGWRVATFDDWAALISYYGGNSVAGGKLKEFGTTYWLSPNTGALISNTFNARGGGRASGADTSFDGKYTSGYWWPFNFDKNIQMAYNSAAITGTVAVVSLTRGSSVRLIKKDTTVPGFTVSISDLNALSTTGTGTFADVPATPDFIEKGICWSTSANPNIFLDSFVAAGDTNKTNYSLTVSPLLASTIYYTRAYIKVDETDIRYSTNIIQFTTLSGAPTSITTDAATNIQYVTATSGGTIVDNASYPTTQRGVCWNTTGSPTISNPRTINGSGPGSFTSSLVSLSPGVTYYVRAYSVNAAGTFYGNEINFMTIPAPNFNLIFNQFEARHAYSLRKLSNTYLGYCLRARRTTSTNVSTEVFVSFDNNGKLSLDSPIANASGTPTIATNLGDFAAAVASGYTSNPDNVNINQNIFVVTWYNQSNNSNTTNENPTQSSLTAQPRIVSTGTLEIINGTATMRFSGAQFLSVLNSTVPYSNSSFYSLGSATTTVANSIYTLGFLSSNARLFLPQRNGIAYNNNGSITWDWLNTSVPFTANTQRLYELVCGASTASAYSNGQQLTPPSTVPSLLVNSVYIRIGQVGSSPSFFLTGTTQEVIAFTGDGNRTTIESEINTYYNVWT